MSKTKDTKPRPKKPSTNPRLEFYIRYLGTKRGWGLVADGDVTFTHARKASVIDFTENELANGWLFLRLKAELRICDRKGVIRDARTYGLDPPSIRG